MKYYAVAKGRKTGIFTSWDDCQKQISGYSGAVYKSFSIKKEAEDFFKKYKESESEEESESILIVDNKKIIEHTNVKLFLEEKKSNYKVDEKQIKCIYNISKKIKEKNVTLTKDEYIQILDILNEIELDQKQCEIDRKYLEEIEANSLPEKEFPFYNKPKPVKNVKRSKILEVYTDGSHFKNGGSGRKGFGAYFVPNEGGFTPKNISIEVDQAFMKKEFGITETEISNPTMEIAACCYALKSVVKNLEYDYNGIQNLSDIKNIKIYADYEGVQKWPTGIWKINKPYIKIIVDKIKGYEEAIKKVGITIEYIHVDGHSGIEGNEMADKLAKGLIKP